ncbi:hypothetical protein CFRS1_v011480 [Colletotrichum fructicola]|nr:hypothetical protein CFRS1_v011480 [Colletotrichum fructicola]
MTLSTSTFQPFSPPSFDFLMTPPSRCQPSMAEPLSPFLDVPLVCNLRLRLTRYEAESPVGAPLPRIECTIGSLDAGVPGPFSPNKARVGLGRLQVSRLQVPGIFGAFDTGVGFGTTQTILRCSASAGQDNES